MGLEDLVFKLDSTGETIYDPATLSSSSSLVFTITNFGTDDLADLGVFVVPGTTIGDVDNPADFPPETDYQDLIRWGEETVQGVELAGGLKLTIPQNDSSAPTRYVTRQAGSTQANKLSMADLPAGQTISITAEVETPPSVVTRRLFISLRVEQTP